MSQKKIEGLLNSVNKKRENTKKRAIKGLNELIRRNQKINFNSVSLISNVSRSWLYQNDEIRKKIEKLIGEQNNINVRKQKEFSKSQNAIVKTLRDRINKLEVDNKNQKKQIESLYGQLLEKK